VSIIIQSGMSVMLRFKSIALLIAAGMALAFAASAQTRDEMDSFEPTAIDITDSIFDPERPAGPDNDPGTLTDPSTVFDPTTWEPIPPEKLELDPSYVETPTGDELFAPTATCTPSATVFCGPQHYPDPGPAGCGGWNPVNSLPLKVFGPFKSYFSYRSQMTPLVGVSADDACHLYLSSPAPLYYCDQSNYLGVLEQLRLRELNKIRLWVGFGAETEPLNQPFEQVTVAGLGTFWALDRKHEDYFRRLREVVAEARRKGLFVEVSFFAPWEGGDFDRFRQGPPAT
jgi:hypothetical protein